MGIHRNFILFLCLLFVSIGVFANPQKITFQSKIYNPDGTALQAPAVQFKFSLMDPLSTCVIFSETFTNVDLSSSEGSIVLNLGDGTRDYPVAGGMVWQDGFDNLTSSYPCQAGGTYSPVSTESRKVVMQFNDGSANGWQTLPAMEINTVPYAMFAYSSERLGGRPVTDFVLASALPGGGTTAASAGASGYLSSTDWTRFNSALVNSADITAALGFTPGATVTSTDITTALTYAPASSSDLSTNYLKKSGGTITGSLVVSNDATVGRLVVSTNGTNAAQAIVLSGAPANGLYTDNHGVLYVSNGPGAGVMLGKGDGNTGAVVVDSGAVIGFASSPTSIFGNVDTTFSRLAANKVALGSGLAGNYSGTFVTGSIGIGVTNPGYALQVSGDISVSGAFKVNGVDIATGSGTVTSVSGTSPISVATSTTTPVISISKADAATNGYLSSTDWTTFNNKLSAITSSDISTALTYQPASSSDLSANYLNLSGGAISGSLIVSNDLTVRTNQLLVNSTGVGIGTAPVGYAKLIVSGSTALNSPTAQFIAGNGSAASAAYVFYSDSSSGMFSPAGNNLGFTTAGVERLRITASGDVGIGTTPSGTTFEIAGGTHPTGNGKNIKLFAQNANAGGYAGGNIMLYGGQGTAGITDGGFGFALGKYSAAFTAPSADFHVYGTPITNQTPRPVLLVGGSNNTFNVAAANKTMYLLRAYDTLTVNNTTNSTYYGIGVNPTITSSGTSSGNVVYGLYSAPTLTSTTAGETVYGIYSNPVAAGASPPTAYSAIFMGGNVGVGTTTPAYALQVSGDISVSGAFKVNGVDIAAGGGTVTSVSGTSPISVATGSSTPVISIARSTAAVDGYLSSSDWTTFNNKLSAITSSDISTALTYQPASSSDLSTNYLKLSGGTVTGNLRASQDFTVGGNFGVGTGAPTELVHAHGGNLLVDNTAGTSYAKIMPDNGSGFAQLTLYSHGIGGAHLYMETGARLHSSAGIISDGHISATGAMASGTGSPNTPGSLTLGTGIASGHPSYVGFYEGGVGGRGSIGYTAGSSDLVFQQGGHQFNGTEVMRIKGNGNVGIGTNNPGYALQVSGDISVSGAFKVNGVNINSGTVTSVSGTSPISVATGTTTPVVSITKADAATNGYLSSGDWTTFNNKLANFSTMTSADVSTALTYAPASSSDLSTNYLKLTGGTMTAPLTNNTTTALHLHVPNTVTGNYLRFGDSFFGMESSGGGSVMTGGTAGATVLGSYGATPVQFSVGNAEKMRISASGDIGIGTVSPGAKLHVLQSDFASNAILAQKDSATVGYNQNTDGSSVQLRNNNTTDGNYSSLDFASRRATLGARIYSSVTGVYTSHDDASYAGDLTFLTSTGGTLSEKMRINGSGDVGIGTAIPTTRLTVADTNATVYATNTYAGITNVSINNYSPGKSVGMSMGVLNGNSSAWAYGSIGVLSVANTANSNMVFQTRSDAVGDLERMRIEGATGNVGIGTTSPGAKLEVDSSTAIRLSNSTDVSNGFLGGVDFYNKNAEGAAVNARVHGLRGPAALTGQVAFETRDGVTLSERMRITASGDVGIGTAAPTEKMVVYGTDINPVIGKRTTHTQLYSGYNAQQVTALDIYDDDAEFVGFNLINNKTAGSSTIGVISFVNKNAGTEGTDNLRLGTIGVFKDGAENSGYMALATTNAGVTAEKVRIDKSGNVGIGMAATTGNRLEVSGNAKVHGDLNSYTTSFALASATTKNLFYVCSWGAAAAGTITVQSRDDISGNLTLSIFSFAGQGASGVSTNVLSSNTYSAGSSFTLNSVNSSPTADCSRLTITNTSGANATTVHVNYNFTMGYSNVTFEQ